MRKVFTIIGARPQFIKAAALSRTIESRVRDSSRSFPLKERIIHTGQHYDYNMSRVFFEELAIPEPDYHLGIGSGSHGEMTGAMLAKVEEVLAAGKPDWVLVYGDTNSTLAGALAAAKLHIPVAHVEAGLRSYNKRMPEEINRLLTDHISDLLFAPTAAAVENLKKEGVRDSVFNTGDIMFDAFLFYKQIAAAESRILATLKADKREYVLATVHRQENTENPHRLSQIFRAFEEIGHDEFDFIIPLHPRTRKSLNLNGLDPSPDSGVRIIDPVGYLDMVCLETNAAVIFTDSGGVQKEAFFAGVPCVTLRDETEWVETVQAGVNFLAGADTVRILNSYQRAKEATLNFVPGLYGDGHTADKIIDCLLHAQ
jgi:UDP-N-acetylglucosamine 2-epimerase